MLADRVEKDAKYAGLCISADKSKVMVIGCQDPDDSDMISVNGGNQLEVVNELRYLGSFFWLRVEAVTKKCLQRLGFTGMCKRISIHIKSMISSSRNSTL